MDHNPEKYTHTFYPANPYVLYKESWREKITNLIQTFLKIGL